MQGPTDETLFAAYLAGDRDAFRALIDTWTPPLRAIMARSGASAAEVDELVQEVFLHLHRSAMDFAPGAALRPWIVTIALNLRRDWQRRPVRRAEWGDLPDFPDPCALAQARLEGQQTAERVRRAVSELPEAQRQVIELHWLSEMPFRDVAKRVGASVGAVRVRAHRGYERIRTALSSEDR